MKKLSTLAILTTTLLTPLLNPAFAETAEEKGLAIAIEADNRDTG